MVSSPTYIANFLLLFLIFSCFTSTTTQPIPNTSSVLDVDGHDLQSNTNYHILPLHSTGESGGGLALSARFNPPFPPCPHNVMQENNQISVGLSLRIFPVEKTQQVISLSSDVNVVFWAATICVQSTVWRLEGIDPFTKQRYVRSGGVVGRPGPETVGNWFRIEKFGEGYKIAYCPTVCSTCRVPCGDVGVFVEIGRRWLGLNGQPLVIVFKKVT